MSGDDTNVSPRRLQLMHATLLIIFCILIMVGSVTGGQFPLLVRLTHLRVQLMMSFVGGLMLAVALLHLLPHGVAVSGSLDVPAIAAVVGLLFTFFLIRVFHVHQHEPGAVHLEPLETSGVGDLPVLPADVDAHLSPSSSGHAEAGGAHASCGHDHAQAGHGPNPPAHAHSHGHRWSWIGLAVGLSLHTLIDGVALGASVAAETGHEGSYLPGLATFLAILLHKPLDAMAITMLMTSRGWSKQATTRINLGFALMCPLGALAFYFGAASLGSHQNLVVGTALGFAAGAFLCISLADLLPEIQFHSHDPAKLSTALVAGALLAFAIRLVEPDHAHQVDGQHSGHNHHAPGESLPSTGHDHAGHDHGGHEHGGHEHEDHEHGGHGGEDHGGEQPPGTAP